MKTVNRILAVLLTAALLLSFAACGGEDKKVEKGVDYDNLKMPDSVASGTVAENGAYKLDWDEKRSCVMLTDKQNGDIWSTIPYDFYMTGKKSGRDAIMMSSPIMLSYVAASNKSAVKTVNGYTGIIKNGSVYSKKVKNGIKVYYCFDKLEIVIPVEYTVRETGLCVSVVPKEIKEYGNLVYKISLAPFLCSTPNTDDKENQYLTVPSGSGALMYTDVRKDGEAREYSEEVYGSDPACYKGEQTLNTQNVRLAVFGAKNAEKAICGIIEEGSESALVEAIAGDGKIGYSAVYPTFYLRGSNISAIAFQGGNVNEVETISPDISAHKRLSVGYYPLSGENASYIGMAKTYEKFISGNEKDKNKAEEKQITLNISGGLQIKQLMLGIPYQKTVCATKLSQAQEIVETVKNGTKLGVDAVLYGFGDAGLDMGKLAGGFELSSVFGSKKDFNKLNDYCKQNSIGLYTDFDIVRFNASGNGFSKTFDSAKASNKFTAYQYFYSVPLRQKDEDIPRYVLLSRAKLNDAAQKLFKTAQRLKLDGISLSSLGSTAYSDYDSPDTGVRSNMERDTAEILNDAKKKGIKISLREANGYAAALADKITDIPVNSSMYDILDADIPLYAAVFKGTKSISTSAINTAVNPRKQFLRSVETGSGFAFELSYGYDTAYATTRHTSFSVSRFSDNEALIKSLAKESEDFYKAVKGAKIVGHTVVSDNVRQTRFDNSVTVLVNYSDEAVTVDGITAEPDGFAFVKGEK